MTVLRWSLPAICLFILVPTAYPQESGQDVFAEVNLVRAQAESVNAPLLSPKTFELGEKEYDWAKSSFASSGYSERIQRRIDKAEAYFREAMRNTEAAMPMLGPTIEAREAAETANAARLAPKEWASGELNLKKAGRALEKEDPEVAMQYGAVSGDTYKTAELQAIRTRYLSEARRYIAEADQKDVGRLAPRTLKQARKLLNEADALLVEDRYQTDLPQALAEKASYEARHAMNIAALAERVRTNASSVEVVILEWESVLSEIAATLDIEADLIDGPSGTSEEIISDLRELQELPAELSERDRQIRGLEEELREIDDRLRGASAERTMMVRQLESQARAREQVEVIGDLFTDDEARVLRNEQGFILRLLGLRFASNSSELGPEAVDLMNKIKAAIDIFPQCDITIEGHTDSQGSATKNLQLSKDRAQAVVDYIVENMRVPDYRVNAVGYGDSRPIANNRTEEGRARNRRIDLIITPKLGGF